MSQELRVEKMSQEQGLNSNHDYPYHDILVIDNTEGQEAAVGSYQVGQSNIDAHGDQKKLFVSKHTLIIAVTETDELRLNDSRNVNIAPVGADQELWTNISRIYYNVAAGGVMVIYFEGVLSEEARDAH